MTAAPGSEPRRETDSVITDAVSYKAVFTADSFEVKAGFSVYIANPYAAWERGMNENTNYLPRVYFPKRYDFSLIDDKILADAVRKLKNRPQKCLGYRTPNVVFN